MSNPDPIEDTVEYNKRNLRHFISGLELLRRQAEDHHELGMNDSDWEGLIDIIIYNLSHSGHQSLAAIMDEWLSAHLPVTLGKEPEPLGGCTEIRKPT